MEKVSVLFVCMGNICRSPTAQGIFETLLIKHGWREQVKVDSAGTHAYHLGSAPDQRAQAAATRRGVDLAGQRARQVAPRDFDAFDYILAMDQHNLTILRGMTQTAEQQKRVRLFMDFASRWSEEEVPDPYYGGDLGFEQVLDMTEDAAEGLLAHLMQRVAQNKGS